MCYLNKKVFEMDKKAVEDAELVMVVETDIDDETLLEIVAFVSLDCVDQ